MDFDLSHASSYAAMARVMASLDADVEAVVSECKPPGYEFGSMPAYEPAPDTYGPYGIGLGRPSYTPTYGDGYGYEDDQNYSSEYEGAQYRNEYAGEQPYPNAYEGEEHYSNEYPRERYVEEPYKEEQEYPNGYDEGTGYNPNGYDPYAATAHEPDIREPDGYEGNAQEPQDYDAGYDRSAYSENTYNPGPNGYSASTYNPDPEGYDPESPRPDAENFGPSDPNEFATRSYSADRGSDSARIDASRDYNARDSSERDYTTGHDAREHTSGRPEESVYQDNRSSYDTQNHLEDDYTNEDDLLV